MKSCISLAGVILVGGRPGGGIALVVVGHVEVVAHGGTQADGLHDVAVIAEGVIAEQAPVGRKSVSGLGGHFGNHPDLRERERDALAKLVPAVDGVHEEGGLDRRHVGVGIAARIEQRLIGQIGGVDQKLRPEPAAYSALLQVRDGGRGRTPAGLVEETGGGAIAHYLGGRGMLVHRLAGCGGLGKSRKQPKCGSSQAE